MVHSALLHGMRRKARWESSIRAFYQEEALLSQVRWMARAEEQTERKARRNSRTIQRKQKASVFAFCIAPLTKGVDEAVEHEI